MVEGMLNFEEELAKFKPSPEVGDIEEIVNAEPLVDVTDIMKRLLNDTPEEG